MLAVLACHKAASHRRFANCPQGNVAISVDEHASSKLRTLRSDSRASDYTARRQTDRMAPPMSMDGALATCAMLTAKDRMSRQLARRSFINAPSRCNPRQQPASHRRADATRRDSVVGLYKRHAGLRLGAPDRIAGLLPSSQRCYGPARARSRLEPYVHVAISYTVSPSVKAAMTRASVSVRP